MDLSLGELQEQSIDAFRRLLGRQCATAQVRAAEPLGFDESLWRSVVEMGLPAMGVPQDLGGLGLGLLDMALIAEVYGEFLAPVPLIETMVAARMLARCGPSAESCLNATLEGGLPLAIMLTEERSKPQLVPAGAIAPILIGLDGGELVAVKTPPPGVAVKSIGSCPMAFRSMRADGGERIILAQGTGAREIHRMAIDEWKTLTAAALAGLSGAALKIGVEYAMTRHAFGAAIGSYQGVSHRLADAATTGEGAVLIARAAAVAADDEPARFSTLASMAFAYCADTAHATAAQSLHVHGGYGFTLEYDIQLFLRRAKAWPLALHDPRREYQHIASALFDTPGALRKWIFD